MFTAGESDVILAALTLVDLSLVANLLLIVIFSGHEDFVSKIHTEDHEDRPEWMGKVDFRASSSSSSPVSWLSQASSF